jgi:excisionase family DNA binding protein
LTQLEGLLTVEQSAKATGLKEPTIRKKIYAREIAHVKLGRAVRVPVSEILRLIQENTVPARRVERKAAAR